MKNNAIEIAILNLNSPNQFIENCPTWQCVCAFLFKILYNRGGEKLFGLLGFFWKLPQFVVYGGHVMTCHEMS